MSSSKAPTVGLAPIVAIAPVTFSAELNALLEQDKKEYGDYLSKNVGFRVAAPRSGNVAPILFLSVFIARVRRGIEQRKNQRLQRVIDLLNKTQVAQRVKKRLQKLTESRCNWIQLKTTFQVSVHFYYYDGSAAAYYIERLKRLANMPRKSKQSWTANFLSRIQALSSALEVALATPATMQEMMQLPRTVVKRFHDLDKNSLIEKRFGKLGTDIAQKLKASLERRQYSLDLMFAMLRKFLADAGLTWQEYRQDERTYFERVFKGVNVQVDWFGNEMLEKWSAASGNDAMVGIPENIRETVQKMEQKFGNSASVRFRTTAK